jgi:hypothetical protein
MMRGWVETKKVGVVVCNQVAERETNPLYLRFVF